MKKITTTFLAALMLLGISCKKENVIVQTSAISNNASTQDLLFDINTLAANTLTIGTQVWMKKNWTANTYRNGDHIPQVQDPAKWAGLTTGAWCWYNNDSANGHIYGKLYNWYAVNDPRELAPAGWHVPSDAEWTILTDFLGGVGGKMKSTGNIEESTGLWYAPNYGATNSSGFTGLPGGCRLVYNGTSTFSFIGYNGFWWSSTQYSPNHAWYRGLQYNVAYVESDALGKQYGLSVRCVKD